MKTTKLLLIISLFVIGLLVAGYSADRQAIAQTSSTVTLVEDFANGSNPPQLNNFNFNHSFTLGTAWDLGGVTFGDPIPQTPPYALTLYAGNEDRVTFNQPSSFAYVQSARVWGYADPAENGLAAARGRVIFEGAGDSKTFTFTGGVHQWQLFEAHETDVGDNGNLLGEITAVTLDAVTNQGNRVMFDDLEVESVTPPTRSNLALTMTGSATNVTIGDTIIYDLTVTNSGPQDAPNVTIADTLPFGGTFVPGSSSSACHLSLGQVVCDLGTLAVNGTRTVTIVVLVGNDACASFTNRATVTAQALDSNPTDNTAVHTATTPLPACADFSVSQTALPVPPLPGEDSLTYTILVKNNGPDTSGSSLQFDAPGEVWVTAVSSDSGVTCSNDSFAATCNLDLLVSGQSKQIYVTGNALSVMSGMQLSEATISPILDDPDLTNNVSRFRFTSDPAYNFTVIGEIGVDQLSTYEDVGGLAINSSGEIAFSAFAGTIFQPTAFGVFRGDGSGALAQIAVDTDFSALPADQYRQMGAFGQVDVNDAGTVVFIEEILRDLNGGHEVVQTTVHTGSGGTLTTIATDSENSGFRFRQYGYATINNLGRVVASYNDRFDDSAVVSFENGQETILTTARSGDYWMKFVGQSDNNRYVAFKEEVVLGLGTTDTLGRVLPGGTVQTVTQVSGSTFDFFSVHPHIGISDFGSVIYKQVAIDPATGLGVEQLKIGGQVVLTELALQNYAGSFTQPKLNNQHRYLFKTVSTSQFGTKGLYTGPHPVSNRVVRANLFNGELMFGSRVIALAGSYAFDINDSGQVGLAVELSNGRILILRADPVAEQDQDGVNDWTELGAANQGDGNGDHIPDSAQPHVASTTTLDGVYPVTFAVDPNQTLANVTPIANPSPGNAPGDPFPVGHFSFEVRDLTPGAASEVTIYLPSWVVVRNWWKYGRTPNNPTPHWYNFAFNGTTGAEINGNVVTLHFVDGQRGDDDLTANGVIVDPGGPTGFPFATYLPTVQR